jgi:signal peptidase II
MQKNSRPFLWLNALFVLVAAAIVIADQLSKNWVRSYTGGQPMFEAGILRIIFVENTGSSFGMFQDQNFVLSIVAVIGVVLIIAFAAAISWKYKGIDFWLTKLSLGLILGGTLGNLLDRLNYGAVTDFIDVGPWPTFNVADSAMVVGVILLVGFIVFSKRVKTAFSS